MQELQAVLTLPVGVAILVLGVAVAFLFYLHFAHGRYCRERDARQEAAFTEIKARLAAGAERFTDITERLARIEGKLEKQP